MAKLIVILTATTMTMSAANAAGQISASMDEAHFATRLSTQVGLFEYCGLQKALGPIPSRLKAFETNHFNGRGQPLISDMGLMTSLEGAAVVSKAGGKQKFCAGLSQHKAAIASSVQRSWATLQDAHGRAKTAGH